MFVQYFNNPVIRILGAYPGRGINNELQHKSMAQNINVNIEKTSKSNKLVLTSYSQNVR